MAKLPLRRTISRLVTPPPEDDAATARAVSSDASQSIADAPDRTPVLLRGTLRTVTLRPRGGAPALEAELDDGTGTLTLVWLGRRRIAGITPGRDMQVTGRIGNFDGQRILYNPRYELL